MCIARGDSNERTPVRGAIATPPDSMHIKLLTEFEEMWSRNAQTPSALLVGHKQETP
jgi:hypothetical protein